MTAREEARRAWALVKGDGCTSAPDLWYADCCARHDADYTTGTDETGRRISRAAADARFRACMQRTAAPLPISRRLLPWVYWAAVRVFGWRHWKRQSDEQKTDTGQPGGAT